MSLTIEQIQDLLPTELTDVERLAPTETDFAYLAGIMDGEGYFNPGFNSKAFGLYVSVIDEPLIDHLISTFGGIKASGGTTTTGNKVYRWYVQRQKEIRQLIIGFMPYLIIKRAQAEAMLELVEHGMKYGHGQIRPQEWYERKRELMQKIQDSRYTS